VKAVVPVIIKDPAVTRFLDIPTTEEHTVDEAFFLDGPVSARVALLDFDPQTGALRPGVRFLPPGPGAKAGRYALANPQDLSAEDTTAVSVFGTVYKTIAMFEEADVLGRRVEWAFDGVQLLVVPRAGEWSNAFYQRESRSLQFFYFKPERRSDLVLTSHSQDIVAHETAHAILDGIAPSLYDAISPQSLALHEAVADLTAVISAFRSRELRTRVLGEERGSIQKSSAFSGLAEEFQAGLDSRRTYLRNLLNNKGLDPEQSGDRDDPTPVDRGDPHALSEVLAGALYTVMVQLHESLKERYARGGAPTDDLVEDPAAGEIMPEAGSAVASAEDLNEAKRRVSGKALYVATEQFKRTILRALDYLPPGEVSFADYGRAIIASDKASHPRSGRPRRWIAEEFVRRSIVARSEDLDPLQEFDAADVSDLQALDLEALIESDWVAYDFANRHRRLLRIHDSIPFRVLPRLAVHKRYHHRDGQAETGEVLFKVSWTDVEDNRLGADYPRRRRVVRGTTLALDTTTRAIRARLTSDPGEDQRNDRDRLLRALLDRDMLRLGDQAIGPGKTALTGVVRGEIVEGLLHLKGAARMLHLTEVE